MDDAKSALLKALEQLHVDVLAVMTKSKLDASARTLLGKIAEDIHKLTTEIQTKPRMEKDFFARIYLLIRALQDFF